MRQIAMAFIAAGTLDVTLAVTKTAPNWVVGFIAIFIGACIVFVTRLNRS